MSAYIGHARSTGAYEWAQRAAGRRPLRRPHELEAEVAQVGAGRRRGGERRAHLLRVLPPRNWARTVLRRESFVSSASIGDTFLTRGCSRQNWSTRGPPEQRPPPVTVPSASALASRDVAQRPFCGTAEPVPSETRRRRRPGHSACASRGEQRRVVGDEAAVDEHHLLVAAAAAAAEEAADAAAPPAARELLAEDRGGKRGAADVPRPPATARLGGPPGEVAGAALYAEDERLEDAVALPRAHGDRARPAPLRDPEAAVDPPVAAQLDHELAAVVGGVLPLPQQPQRARARKAPRLQLAQRAPRHLRRAAFAREARDEERAAAADRRADDEVEELAHRLARQLLHLLDHR